MQIQVNTDKNIGNRSPTPRGHETRRIVDGLVADMESGSGAASTLRGERLPLEEALGG